MEMRATPAPASAATSGPPPSSNTFTGRSTDLTTARTSSTVNSPGA